MQFHTFGDKNDRAVVLIHGVLTPWQMWDYQIEKLKNDFYIIIPALDGHTAEEHSEFLSVEHEAEKIEDYIIRELGGRIYAVCGISMGAVISGIILENKRIQMEKLIMDGAPFATIPTCFRKIMISNYLKIVHSSKKREVKTLEGFKKNLLPEKYLPDYLAFIDKTSDESIRNMVSSVFANHYPKDITSSVDVLFIHGTRANDILAAKAARRLKKDYPNIKIICHNGLKHCENALFHPDKWYADAIVFLRSYARTR